MERDPLQSNSNQVPAGATKLPQGQERSGFFEKWRKKEKSAPESTPEKQKKTTNPERETVPHTPQAERRAFGKEILGIIFGEKNKEKTSAVQVEVPEAQPQSPNLEQTPQFERATRMRRFARVIIARVLGEAANEPERARQHNESKPLSTEGLIEAANDLREATDDLTETTAAAREITADSEHRGAASAFESRGEGGFDSFDAPGRDESWAPHLRHSAAERIDDRLRQLEISAEISRSASIAAVGLGVLAVIFTGTEYFSRKHNEREIRGDIKEVRRESKKQERTLRQQQAAFENLRDGLVSEFARNQRQDYYNRLSTFTHQQADRTREANSELRQVVEEAVPAATPHIERRHREETVDRREWHPRQPEARADEQPEVAPLVRVEMADTIESAPGRQIGNAGTGFFGGGIAEATGRSDLELTRKIADPNSPEARKLEELRKMEQARLQQNAWIYSAALAATLVAGLIGMIFIG